MRKILLLCLLSTLFLACENASNYITVHLKDVNLSTDINVGENESVITGEPTLVKLALGNTITQPTDYYLTFIPQVGQGALTHDGNELKANSEYKYTSTKSNDVVELYYTPKSSGEHRFTIAVRSDDIVKEIETVINSQERDFGLVFEQITEVTEIDRPTVFMLSMADNLPDKVMMSAVFNNNGKGEILFKDNKSGQIINLTDKPVEINRGQSEVTITTPDKGNLSVSFTLEDGNDNKDFAPEKFTLERYFDKPDFKVTATRTDDSEIHASGGFEAQVTIDPFKHPENNTFDIYCNIYQNKADAQRAIAILNDTLAVRSMITSPKPIKSLFVKRLSASEGRSTYATSSDVITSTLFVPVPLAGEQTAVFTGKSAKYLNERFDELSVNATDEQLTFTTTPSEGNIITAALNGDYEIKLHTSIDGDYTYKLAYTLSGGSGTVKNSKDFVVKAGEAFAIATDDKITFTPTTLGDIAMKLTASCYTTDGTLIETKETTLTYRVSNNPLELVIEEYPTPQTGVSTPLYMTLKKKDYEGSSFSVNYTLLSGSGVFKNGSSEVKPNSNFSMKKDVLYTFGYTPAVAGTHRLLLAVSVDGNIENKEVVINVPVHIKATVNPAIGGDVKGAGVYEYGTPYSVSVTPQTGYAFTGWYENGEIVSEQTNISATATADRVLEARLNHVDYNLNISIEPTDGGIVTGGGKHKYGEVIDIKATANTGFYFNGYSGDITSTNATYQLVMPAKDVNVKASFERVNTPVTITKNDGGIVTLNNESVEIGRPVLHPYGSKLTYKAVPDNKMRFVGWYKNGQLISSATDLVVTVELSALVLEARFDKGTRNIVVTSANTAQGTAKKTGNPDYGSIYEIEATPNEEKGYHFIGWYSGGSLVTTQNPYSFKVENDMAFEARFEINTYTVKMGTNNSGASVTGFGDYKHGQNCTISASNINPDYKFNHFLVNGKSEMVNPYSFDVKSNTTIDVVFENISNRVSIDISGNTTNPGDIIVNLQQPSVGTTSVTVTVSYTQNGSPKQISKTVSINDGQTSGRTPSTLSNITSFSAKITNVKGAYYNFKY